MSEDDSDQLADKLEREAEYMQRQSDGLQAEAQNVDEDWQRKRADQGVPGAPPSPDDAEDNDAEHEHAEHEHAEHDHAEHDHGAGDGDDQGISASGDAHHG